MPILITVRRPGFDSRSAEPLFDEGTTGSENEREREKRTLLLILWIENCLIMFNLKKTKVQFRKKCLEVNDL